MLVEVHQDAKKVHQEACVCQACFCFSQNCTANLVDPIDVSSSKMCCFEFVGRNVHTCGNCTFKCCACTCGGECSNDEFGYYGGFNKCCCNTASLACPPKMDVGMGCCGVMCVGGPNAASGREAKEETYAPMQDTM